MLNLATDIVARNSEHLQNHEDLPATYNISTVHAHWLYLNSIFNTSQIIWCGVASVEEV